MTYHAKSHITGQNIVKVLDILVSRPTWAVAMRAACGASERTAYEWRAKSIAAAKANDRSSPFYLEWRGAWDYFHCHAGRARAENKISYEALVRDQAAHGIEEAVLGPDQRPIYRERPEYIGRSDQFIRDAEILASDDDVAWYRLEHDDKGHPIPLTKITQLPAPLRKAVLAASHPDYKESLDVQVQHSGTVQISKPLERLASEPRAGEAELRRLASMSPEERRAFIHAEAEPTNSHGQATRPNVGDYEGEQPKLIAPNPPRPAYAKPVKPLDQSGRGRGEVPSGGFKIL